MHQNADLMHTKSWSVGVGNKHLQRARTRTKSTKIFYYNFYWRNTRKMKSWNIWSIGILKCLVYWNIGPCKRLKIVLRCSGTVGIDDDETLDLILQVHYWWWDFGLDTASPLRCPCESSPHKSDFLSTWWWVGDWQFSGCPSLAPVFLNLGTFSSRHWPIFLILIFRGSNQSLLEAMAGREGNNFLIGWSFKSLAVVGRSCGCSLPSETQEWARLNPSPQAIIWVATLPNLDFLKLLQQKTLKQREGPFHIEKGIKYLPD